MARSAIRFIVFAAALLLTVPGLSAQAAEPTVDGTCTLAPLGTPCVEIQTTSAIIQHPETKQTISVDVEYWCKTDDEVGFVDLEPMVSMSLPLGLTCDGTYRSATVTTVAAWQPGPLWVTAEIARAANDVWASSAAWVTVMPALPNAVESMTLSNATSTTIKLAWTAPAPRESAGGTKVPDNSITGYKIGWTEASTGRVWESQPPHYQLASSPIALTGLIPNSSYDVYVIPVNPSGDGAATHRSMSTLPKTTPPPVKTHAAWHAFNAAPEPVVKGKSITIKARLLAGSHAVKAKVSVQFRPSGARAYATIKTSTTSSNGSLSTTITASKTGTWRAVYQGSSTISPATSAGDTVKVIPPPVAPKSYPTCSVLNKVYPHGVGRSGARDHTSGGPVTNFTVNTKAYNLNNGPHKAGTKTDYDLDRDNDGIACEKH
jgi:hypothetical protein